MHAITKDEFIRVLRSIPRPGGRQSEFLKAHADAEGRAETFRSLARKAQYKSYRAINLHYGKLARQIGDSLGHPNAGISLLMAAAKPNTITNKEWVLVMRPEFAEALVEVGWI